MELTLNLIWLAIAAGSFAELARWGFGQAGDDSSRLRRKVVATAVVCVVALLFPIISISDDLCSNPVFVETSIKRRAPREDADHGFLPSAATTAVLSTPRHAFHLTSQGLAEIGGAPRTPSPAALASDVRGPPQQAC